MSKRQTDTDKWKKKFIRGLDAPYKLLWLYILDECDHAGIWHVDFDVAVIRIGLSVDEETALKSFGEKVTPFSDGEKWFIRDFIEFQYGALNPANRVHNSVLKILEKYNLSLENKPLASPLEGSKDKDIDKDTVLKNQSNAREKLESEGAAEKIKATAEAMIEIVLPWQSDEFTSTWQHWKKFKQEQFKFKYTPRGEQAALKELAELSEGVEGVAVAIIHRSMGNGWKGFFKLKPEENNGNVRNRNTNTVSGTKSALERVCAK